MRITPALLGVVLGASGASAAEGRRATIVGLMGTTMFASRHCDAFEVNPEKLSTFLKGFGATDPSDPDVLDLAAALKVEKGLERTGDPVETCRTLWLRFGANGTVGARLFRPK